MGSLGFGEPGKSGFNICDEQIAVSRAQAEVLHLQAHELKHELSLRHWSLRMHHISDVMKVTFEVAAALTALGVIAIVAAAIWSAAHDDGAVIEAFKVPPDMAQKGLTGDVVASQLLDRLTDMQARTDSIRAPSSYASNFGDRRSRIQVPDTGVSIAEAYRYCSRHGSAIRRVFRVKFSIRHRASSSRRAPRRPSRRALRRPANAISTSSSTGPPNMSTAQTQPFRYGTYLLRRNRYAEARWPSWRISR